MNLFVLSKRCGKVVAHYPLSPPFDPSFLLKKVLKGGTLDSSGKCLVDAYKKTFLIRRRRLPSSSFWNIRECMPFESLYIRKKQAERYPWPACATSKDGRILWINDAMKNFLGCSLKQVLNRPLNVFLVKVEHPESKMAYALSQNEDDPSIKISSFDKVDNCFVFYFSFFEKRGDVVDMISTLSAPCAMMDDKGVFFQTNKSLAKHLDSSLHPNLERWVGKKITERILSHFLSLKKSTIHQVFLSPPFPVKGHGHFSILSSRLTHKGVSDHFLCIFVPQKEGASDGENIEKMQLVGQLASGIVHDFNNLLTGILGFCDLLLNRHEPAEMTFQDIQQIKQSAMRASQLIQKLLNFSKSSPSPECSFSIKKCLHNLIPLIGRMVGPKILPSVHCAADDSFVIHADFGQVEQMILNLAINARDAMERGGDLFFFIEKKDLKKSHSVVRGSLPPNIYVVLKIKDTGAGIEPKNMERIFDSFFSTKDPGQGTGLGLSNVLESMEKFRGGIEVKSKEGVGTEFLLFFPESRLRVKDFSLREEAQIQVQKTHHKMTILLVEDEDAVRLFASRALRERGHHVIEMRDGVQALDYIKDHKDVHMLITDVMMPGVDGPSLAESICKEIPLIKVLFVSGYPEEEVRRLLSQNLTDIYFLPKPFALNDLVNKVQCLDGA